MTLENSRREIDEIDDQIIKLFTKRMDITDNIARVKMKDGLNILNSEREQAILNKVEAAVPLEYSQYCVSLYNEVMALSRLRQRNLFSSEINEKSKFEAELGQLCDEIVSPRVAVQGVPGSYSQIAASNMYPSCKLEFKDKWSDVLCCIQDGTADYGVLPVENSSAGTVTEVYDLLLKYKYNIVKAFKLQVNHCLLVIPGSTLHDVKDVYSHPHAFPQCSSFFEEHSGLNKINHPNTAMAAQMVAKSGDKSKAALASKECAKIFGLEILAESIQQVDNNRTRFISISKRREIHNNADKISLVISLPHITGSLYRTLARFSLNGLNLTQIISRPNKDKLFEYFFYVDFNGNIKSRNTMTLLGALNDELPDFYFLGNYDEN